MNHSKSLEDLLLYNKVYPIKKYWKEYEVTHFKDKPDEKELNRIINQMKDTFGSRNGLYAYFKNDKLLYVGKAKPLFNRIKSHFQETYDKKKYNDLWPSFFRDNAGLMNLYWIEIGDKNLENKYEKVRVAYESIITGLEEPEFEKYKKRRRGKKRNAAIKRK